MSNKVLIIDDDAALRDSLSILLQSHGFDCVLYETGDAFLVSNLKKIVSPILLDIRMPGKDGIDVLQEGLMQNPHLYFIMMSGHADIATAVKAVKLGAYDFLEKPFRDDQILPLIKSVQTSIQSNQEENLRQLQLKESLDKLTPREKQVLDNISEGLSNKLIAHNLGLSVRTIETHRAHLMSKLDVKSLPELLKIYIQVEGSEKLSK